jgi:hypothetical protein
LMRWMNGEFRAVAAPTHPPTRMRS